MNSSNGDIFLEVNSVPDENTIMLKNLTLEPGQYWYSIETSKIEYALLTISSKARNGETLPLRTNCWVSAEETDAQKSKLAVFAEVKQANSVSGCLKNADPDQLCTDLYSSRRRGGGTAPPCRGYAPARWACTGTGWSHSSSRIRILPPGLIGIN
mgnify:CR=1 FL=1